VTFVRRHSETRGGWACRPAEMYATMAARAEGGADASEGAEGAHRRERRPDRMFLEGGVSDRRRSDRLMPAEVSAYV